MLQFEVFICKSCPIDAVTYIEKDFFHFQVLIKLVESSKICINNKKGDLYGADGPLNTYTLIALCVQNTACALIHMLLKNIIA